MKISEREREILRMLCLPNKIIAQKLNVSLSTVKNHLHRLLNKFYWVDNRTELFFEALKRRIIKLEDVITK